MMQNMGPASKLIRFMILILLVIILWKMWYYIIPSPKIIANTPPIVVVNDVKELHGIDESKIVALATQLRVAVYYEALCPDSRDFIVRELEPTFKKLHEIIALDLVPYGKATSMVDAQGNKSFKCQHGPKECSANTVHACVTKYVKDKLQSLEVVSCMITINSHNADPVSVGAKCLSKSSLGDLWPSIKECSTGTEGKELLYHMGKMTDDLGHVDFIPTITMDESQDKQSLILKNFIKAVCDIYNGSTIPIACKQL